MDESTKTPPTSRHTMRVTLDREALRLVPVCHEQDGAVCRVICAAGCESFSYPEHEHKLEPVSYCNAVEFLSNSDVECCCDYAVEVPLSDGMPIEVTWDGDGYSWFPVSQSDESGDDA